MVKCEHFKIHELVDRYTFNKFGEEAWQFFNPIALIALDGVREFFHKQIIVIDWFWGGEFQYRGLRPIYCTEGATYSQHRFGDAFDGDIEGVTAKEARQAILENQDHELLKHITCIEADVNWLHFDCRNIAERIKILNP